MPRVAPILTTFNGGEWSPHLHGRVDINKYPNACRVMENFLPLSQGAATARPGTRFVAATKSDGVARLVPFEFSTEQAYVLEFGNFYVRFHADRGRVESPPGTPVEVVTPYATADLAALRWTQSADILYLVHPSYAPRKLVRSSHTSWALSLVELANGPFRTDPASASRPTVSASSASAGAGVTITASAAVFAATDVGRLLKIKHSTGNWGYGIITGFTSATVVTVTLYTAIASTSATGEWQLGAFGDTVSNGGYPACITFHEERLWFGGTASQPTTFWASRSNSFQDFAATDLDNSDKDDHGLIFTIADDRVNRIHWMSSGKTLVLGTASGEFVVQASSANEALTPSNVMVRREGTVGAANLAPVRVGSSVLFVQRARRKLHELFYSFEADSQVSPESTLLARHVTRPRIKELAYQQEPWGIVWGCLDDGQLVGCTYLREQSVFGWHRHPIGGTDAKVLSLAAIPGDGQDELWLLVERSVNGGARRHIEYLGYEYWPENATDRDFAQFVDSSLALDNGINADLTPGPGATVQGSTAVNFAAGSGVFSSGDVGREIRYRHLDTITGLYRTARALVTSYGSATAVGATILAAFPSTSAIAALGWRLTVTSISGLSHLEGETVQVLADGAAHPAKTVSSGAITLDRPATIVQVGLGYVSTLETLDIEAGGIDGTSQSKRKRIHEVAVRFHDSLAAKLGWDESSLDEVLFRDGGGAMDEAPPLFSGDKTLAFPKGWQRAAHVRVVRDQPLPCTVLAAMPRLTTNDG